MNRPESCSISCSNGGEVQKHGGRSDMANAEIEGILKAYLTKNGKHAQSWMYEQLAVAIELNKGSQSEVKESLDWAVELRSGKGIELAVERGGSLDDAKVLRCCGAVAPPGQGLRLDQEISRKAPASRRAFADGDALGRESARSRVDELERRPASGIGLAGHRRSGSSQDGRAGESRLPTSCEKRDARKKPINLRKT